MVEMEVEVGFVNPLINLAQPSTNVDAVVAAGEHIFLKHAFCNRLDTLAIALLIVTLGIFFVAAFELNKIETHVFESLFLIVFLYSVMALSCLLILPAENLMRQVYWAHRHSEGHQDTFSWVVARLHQYFLFRHILFELVEWGIQLSALLEHSQELPREPLLVATCSRVVSS